MESEVTILQSARNVMPRSGDVIWRSLTLPQVLDDLCVRFILYLPAQELNATERICFAIEEAHWFYEDFVREANPRLPNINLRSFIHAIWQHIPQTMVAHIPLWQTEQAFTSFMMYKTRIDVRGVIILNPKLDRCILVKGWKSGASWSFPRGKINQAEDDRMCATREALEETGHDLTGMVGENDFIEILVREQNIKLYIAPGVPESTHFEPQTRKEISKIEWFALTELPGYKIKGKQKQFDNRGRFYMVAPFVGQLRKWISTVGKEWLKSQRPNSATHHIEEEVAHPTEEETEAEDGYMAPPSASDPVAGLKSLLGIQGAADVTEQGQMNESQQKEASERLKDMLQIRTPAATATVNVSIPNGNIPNNVLTNPARNGQPKAQALLDILNGHPSSSQPPSHQVPMQMPQEPFASQYPLELAPPRLPLVPVPQNSPGYARPPGFNPLNGMNYLPSPPPSSSFGFPTPPFSRPPFGQMAHRNSSLQQQFKQTPQQSHMGPQPYLPHRHNLAPTQPLTPVEAFIPSHPPDPSQAGMLLSILRSVPAPQQQPEGMAPKMEVPVSQSPPPPPPPHQQQQKKVPVALQAPPPPRGPRAVSAAALRASSTSCPPRQAFSPPRHRPTPPPAQQPRISSSPVNVEAYATRKPTSLVNNFDRRNSVSSDRAKVLLDLFRPSSVAPQVSAPPEQQSTTQPPARPPTATQPPLAVQQETTKKENRAPATENGSAAPPPPPVTVAPIVNGNAAGTAAVGAQFDRRMSVNAQQQQALLSLFRSASVAPPKTKGFAVDSSPETLPTMLHAMSAKTVADMVQSPAPAPLKAAQVSQKMPPQKAPEKRVARQEDRVGLMQYLEAVAKGA